MYKIAGIISTSDLCLHFLNTSILFYTKMEILLKPRKQRLITIDVPFTDDISGLAMIKLLDLKTGFTNMINVKFIRNTGFLDVTK